SGTVATAQITRVSRTVLPCDSGSWIRVMAGTGRREYHIETGAASGGRDSRANAPRLEKGNNMVALHTREYQLEARAFIDNPPHEDLRKMVAEMPNAKPTVYGNLDVFTRVDARSTAST